MSKKQEPCPCCGRCPVCGRGGEQVVMPQPLRIPPPTFPTYPNYPPPPYPWWGIVPPYYGNMFRVTSTSTAVPWNGDSPASDFSYTNTTIKHSTVKIDGESK